MRLLYVLYAICCVPIVGVVTSALLVPALPFVLLPRGRRERYAFWTNSLSCYIILRYILFTTLDIRGRENIPFGQPYLVVANHRSWIDVLTLIWAARAQGISKRMVSFIPVLGLLGYLGGAVFFDRRYPDARRRAKEESLFLLRNGVPLHIYPEGTRTRDGKLSEKVHFGMLEACWEAGIQVVPCGLWGTEEVIPVESAQARPFRTVKATFRSPLQPSDYPDALSFARAAWQQVRELVADYEQEDAKR